MVLKRGLWCYSLFVALLLFLLCQSASALFDSASKQGSVNYSVPWGDDSGLLTGRINYAVYDDPTLYTVDTGYASPGDGNFVYVYQVVNDSDSYDDITYFGILGLNNINVSGIGSEDYLIDPEGYHPSDEYVDDTNGAVWTWSLGNGFELILTGEYSCLLILASDYGPVTRDYEIKGQTGLPGPGGDGDIPEPSVIALLGLGGTFLLRRNKKTHK